MSKKLSLVESYTKVNEFGFTERFYKFDYIACTCHSTDLIARFLFGYIRDRYLPFARSSVDDIWIESVNIIEQHDSWYKIEVVFGDINNE